MTKFNTIRLLFSLSLLIFTSACFQIFEHDADVQARKALTDLMEIQEKFKAENGRYAKNMTEMSKFNLEYHTGIVYMEIEAANKDGYRAISLPAESTTARVFAYDSKQGGYYEMDDIEVSRYVLGALNFIRKEQSDKNIMNNFFMIILAGLLFLGIRFQLGHKQPEYRLAFAGFFLSMVPLVWSVAVLNHLNPDVVLSRFITGMTAAALVCAVLALLIEIVWWIKRRGMEVSAPIWGLYGSTLVICLSSGGVLAYTFWEYYLKS